MWIPNARDETHKHFTDAARTTLEEIFRASETNLSIWESISDRKTLERITWRTASANFMHDNSHGGNDYITTLTNALGPMKYLPAAGGRNSTTFPITKWVRGVRNNPGSILWFPVPREARSALASLLAFWAGIVISEVTKMPDTERWRLWLLLDELGQLPPLDGLKNGLTAGRKPGLAVAASIQDISQLKELYGDEGATTLLSSFSTTFILRQQDPDTADYFSRRVGDYEVREWLESQREATATDHSSSNSSRTEHVRVKREVLTGELRRLPDRECYLLLSHHPVARVTIPIPSLPPKQIEAFMPWPPGTEPTCERAVREQAEMAMPVCDASARTHTRPAQSDATELLKLGGFADAEKGEE